MARMEMFRSVAASNIYQDAALEMPPDFVVRPAGVWDSRAPFDEFLRAFKEINRRSALAELTSLKTERSWHEKENTGISMRSFFGASGSANRNRRASASDPRANAPYSNYRKGLGRTPDGTWRNPTPSEVDADLEGVIEAAREAAIVRHLGVFEVYVRCWALNVLLAKLELGIKWTKNDRTTACRLSPVHQPKRPLTIGQLLHSMPELREQLEPVPPFFRHPVTRAPMLEAKDFGSSAYDAIQFWIALRNLLVHSDGWTSTDFVDRYGRLWDHLLRQKVAPANPADRAEYRRMTLRAGAAVPITHSLVGSAALCIYRASLTLNEFLVDLSNEKRGSQISLPDSPDVDVEVDAKKRASMVDAGGSDLNPSRVPTAFNRPRERMLRSGDHEVSLRWATEDKFRRALILGTPT